MSPQKLRESALTQVVALPDTRHISDQEPTGMHGKSARKVQGQFSKGDARYWMPKLFKWQRSANYSIQTQFRGQRVAFTLRTANKELAAKRAAAIYEDLIRLGVEATLEKHRAKGVKEPVGIATVGQWIEAARGVSATNPATFAQYAASLRLIAGQILAVRKTNKRFGPGVKGGARAYRAGIDAASLETLSDQAVQRWRLAYVAQAKNPAQECSRMTSANSTIRQARSLFADKVVRFLPRHPASVPSPVFKYAILP